MALEAVLTVTLGLIIIWSLLSIVTSMALDWVNARIQFSASRLRDLIAGMLLYDDLVNHFYDHSQIRVVTPRAKMVNSSLPDYFKKSKLLNRFTTRRVFGPDNIPGALFAEAVFDIFVYDGLSPEEPREELSMGLIQTNIRKLQLSRPNLAPIVGKLFPGIDRPVILDAKIAEIKSNIESWYSNSLGNLIERKIRFNQQMALVLGFVIALLVNFDLIAIAKVLWIEPTARRVLMAQASDFELTQQDLAANPEEALQNFRSQFVGLSLPIGWGFTRVGTTAFYDDQCQMFPQEVQAFGIPIIGSNLCITPPEPNSQTNLIAKLFGIFITAFSAGQGAQFWSELLKKVVAQV